MTRDLTAESRGSRSGEGAAGRGRYLAASLLLLLAGVAAMVYLSMTRRGPSGQMEKEPGRLVRVFEARRGPHRVAVTAFGTSRASQEWTAIAEVAGRAVSVHERFEPGEILPAKTLLVQIDPTDYKLAVARCEAELRAKLDELRELDQTEKNLQEIIVLQHHQLLLAQSEYERQQRIFQQNAVSRSALETAEDAMVARLTAVQDTTNRLDLVPVQRELLWAGLEVVQTQLEQAARQLEKCSIRLPFAARCASKQIEPEQFVATGERLGTFLALDWAEVVAMVEVAKMRVLFPKGVEGLTGPMDLAEMAHRDSLWKQVKIPAEIRWGPKEQGWTWKGRLARATGAVDPATRTIPVVFEVPHPYGDIRPGLRPPLVPGAFCEVTIYGAILRDVAVIPRDCLHDGRVYLLRGGQPDEQGILQDAKLEIAPVEVLVLEEDRAVIEKGMASGDRVILGDPLGDWKVLGGPATGGMPLRGQVVGNPVEARPDVQFPPDLFEDRSERDQGPAKPKGPAPKPRGEAGP